MSDYITQDLFGLILKWLPVKTLLKWRCVCKSWKELIDSTSFILAHLSVQRSRIIVQNQNLEYLLLNPRTLPEYDTLRGPNGVQIRGASHLSVVCSVHGVICLCDRGGDQVILWNPSIRQFSYFLLPKYLADRDGDFRYCGFSIDPSSGHFKIAIISFFNQSIALFSSTEQAWTVNAIDSQQLGSENDVPQVLINGVAHWLASVDGNLVIFSFDFVKDMLGTIELPEVGLKSESHFQFKKIVCKWKDLLSFVHLQDEIHTCDVWVMQNGSWSKMSTLNLANDIVEVFYVFEDWGRILAATCEDLVLYDPKDGCFPLRVNFMQHCFFLFAIDHVESFVFPVPNALSCS